MKNLLKIIGFFFIKGMAGLAFISSIAYLIHINAK